MSRIVVEGLDGVRALVGVPIPPTEWLVVDQDRVDAFAACTGDAQWIHVDVARASQSGFGGTIAHGYLTLALIPLLWHSRFDVREIDAAINVGFDRVRFAAPLLVGTRIRARFAVLETTHAPHGLRTVTRATIEAERVEKPVCIADLIVLYRAAA